MGGIEVSEQHANFLINRGGVGAASAGDVVALMRNIQSAVQDRFGVHLEPEVQLVGDWPLDE